MADDAPKPVADIYALVPRAKFDDPDMWLQLGPVWENRDGSLGGTMHLAPVQWQRGVARKFVIQFRKEGSRSET